MTAGLWHNRLTACGTGGRPPAQVGVAAQYAAIAPGSAQTWLVKMTAILNCEARRRDGWRAGCSGVRGRAGREMGIETR